MRPSAPTIFLDPASRRPAYLQIAQALMSEIHTGRFHPGDRLPGYRALAEQLGVSRTTTLAAYAELQSEGWVTSRPGEGSVVAAEPPRELPGGGARAEPPAGIGFDLPSEGLAGAGFPAASVLEVATGVPDPRLVPGAALARAYRRVLTVNPQASLGAGDARGHPRLREALGRHLAATRGIRAEPDALIVTRGSQMAFFLAAQALFAPGDIVAVEALGDRGVWDAFTRAGARCLPVPVDGGGLDVEALATLASQTRLRAVLVSPQRQYPTLSVLAPDRRRRLLDLAAAHRFAVLESDLDSEFHLDGRPVAPLAASDPAGVVIHFGVLSKIFSSGLRLGLVHATPAFVERMRQQRLILDGQGDPVLERAMAELLEDGEVQRHVNRLRQIYRRRRDVLCAALVREAGDALELQPPVGGLSLWAGVRSGVDVDAWAARALRGGISFRPGRQFSFDGTAVQGLRMGFSNFAEATLLDVAGRMGRALRETA
jgi:GntR family transcriptional regulator/MocR family aminotransferase